MNQQYEFCPRCGALMREGVCQSCEFTTNVNPTINPNINPNINPQMQNPQQVPNYGQGYVNPQQAPNYNQGYVNPQQTPNYNQGYVNPQQTSNYNYGYNPYQNNTMGMNIPSAQPPKKKKTGLIVGIVIGCIVFVLLIAILLGVGIAMIVKEAKNQDTDVEEDYVYEDDYDFYVDDDTEDVDNYDDDYEDVEDDYTWEDTDDGLIDLDGDGIGDLEYESGIEGLNSGYYPVITDYIRYDLSYSVSFLEYSDDEGNVECYYPYLKGDQDFIPYFNQAFYMIAEGSEELADEYDCQASSIAYVTYMDEEILSVVFIEMYTFDDGSNYEDILCYSFDMKSGELLEFALKDVSDNFVDELEARCMEESTSDASYLFTEYTNEELRDILTNEEYSLVAFYTPFGMEIGITYEGYWCCATFKDYEQYISIVEEEATEF